jgi:predicted secreted protein
MSPVTAFAIYFIVWWIVLFAVLPFGVRSQEEAGEIVPGSEPGAPAVPHLWAKLFWTTVMSAVVFGLGVLAFARGWLTLDMLSVW